MTDAEIILTACDHSQNGFVALARWPGLTLDEARDVLASVDASFPQDAEPDSSTEEFTLVLDLYEEPYTLLDNSRNLPLQIATRLGGDELFRWLNERPDPEAASSRGIPILSRDVFASFAKPRHD